MFRACCWPTVCAQLLEDILAVASDRHLRHRCIHRSATRRGKLTWLGPTSHPCGGDLFLLIADEFTCSHHKRRMPCTSHPFAPQGALQVPRNTCPTTGTLGKVQLLTTSALRLPVPVTSGGTEQWLRWNFIWHLMPSSASARGGVFYIKLPNLTIFSLSLDLFHPRARPLIAVHDSRAVNVALGPSPAELSKAGLPGGSGSSPL